MADTPWVDSTELKFQSLMTQIADIFSNVVSQQCASNVVYFLCHAAFKECKDVGKGESVGTLVPSLLCRSECETRSVAWNECLLELEKDPEQQAAFEHQMEKFSASWKIGIEVGFFRKRLDGGPKKLETGADGFLSPFRLLSCDAPGGNIELIAPEDNAISYALGQYPGPAEVSWSFPFGMSTDFLYPEASSTFTDDLGVSHEVSCFIPGEAVVAQADCPSPYVPNPDLGRPRSCLKPCPVPAYR
jgi:hypothetical protein